MGKNTKNNTKIYKCHRSYIFVFLPDWRVYGNVTDINLQHKADNGKKKLKKKIK